MQTYEYFVVRTEPLQPGRKTHDYSVINRTSGETIGTIKWYGPWRQYCFFPAAGSVWSSGCLADIQTAVKRIREET